MMKRSAVAIGISLALSGSVAAQAQDKSSEVQELKARIERLEELLRAGGSKAPQTSEAAPPAASAAAPARPSVAFNGNANVDDMDDVTPTDVRDASADDAPNKDVAPDEGPSDAIDALTDADVPADALTDPWDDESEGPTTVPDSGHDQHNGDGGADMSLDSSDGSAKDVKPDVDWTPLDLPGLALWLDAAVGIETDGGGVAAWRDRPRSIVIPTFRNRRGHPVVFPRPLWPELRNSPDQVGARAVVLAHHGEIVEVPVDDEGIVKDIDTREQYATEMRGPSV